MHTSAHLHFKGDCREAFRFYAEVLGGLDDADPEQHLPQAIYFHPRSQRI